MNGGGVYCDDRKFGDASGESVRSVRSCGCHSGDGEFDGVREFGRGSGKQKSERNEARRQSQW